VNTQNSSSSRCSHRFLSRNRKKETLFTIETKRKIQQKRKSSAFFSVSQKKQTARRQNKMLSEQKMVSGSMKESEQAR
jgi:hypothetical protein